MSSRLLFLFVALFVIAMVAVACSDEDGNSGSSSSGDTLKTVKDRGKIIIGVKDSQPGFGNLEPDGSFSGQDVEYARAMAAALFDDTSKVEFVVASASDRFELLASEEIDVLIRTTTWTSIRDIDLNGSVRTQRSLHD